MRVDVSAEAGEVVSPRARREAVGMGGSPEGVLLGDAGVHARGYGAAAGDVRFQPGALGPPGSWFRAPAGRMPDVLEIGMRGRRHPRVEAYWDGCAFAL